MSRDNLLEDNYQLQTHNQIDFAPSEQEQTGKSSKAKAIFYANNYCIFQAIYQLGFKQSLDSGMGLITAFFIRYLIGLLLDVSFLKWNSLSFTSDIYSWKTGFLVLCRSVILYLSMVALLISLKMIPVTIVSLIIQMGSFWASIIAYFILNDVLAPKEIICILIGYTGVVFIIIGDDSSSERHESSYLLGIWTAVLASFLFGLVLVFSRALRSVHFLVLSTNYDLVSLVGSSFLLARTYFTSDDFFSRRTQTSLDYFLLAIFSISGGISAICQTYASQIEKAGIVGAVFYGVVFYSFLGDIFIFNSSFTILQFVGGALILGPSLYLALRK